MFAIFIIFYVFLGYALSSVAIMSCLRSDGRNDEVWKAAVPVYRKLILSEYSNRKFSAVALVLDELIRTLLLILICPVALSLSFSNFYIRLIRIILLLDWALFLSAYDDIEKTFVDDIYTTDIKDDVFGSSKEDRRKRAVEANFPFLWRRRGFAASLYRPSFFRFRPAFMILTIGRNSILTLIRPLAYMNMLLFTK